MVWNVSVKYNGSIYGFQFQGNSITNVLEQAKRDLVGDIIKIVLADYDND